MQALTRVSTGELLRICAILAAPAAPLMSFRAKKISVDPASLV